MPSCYCPDLNLDLAAKRIELSGDEHHHLVRVLRHRVGDEVKLNSGNGILAQGEILLIEKSKTTIKILQIKQILKPNPKFALAFSLLKSKNDEWLIEKATELGASNVYPLVTDFTIRKQSVNVINRFRQTALSAIKQCDNLFLPCIKDVASLENAIQQIKQDGYIPIVASEQRPVGWMDSLQKGVSYCFIIGPEGGFSLNEFIYMRESGIIEVSLSKLILRAETAAIVAASQFTLLNKS